VTERQIATHAEPARRDEANFIVRLDLTEHGMAGKYEQMWTRTEDQHSFELCCPGQARRPQISPSSSVQPQVTIGLSDLDRPFCHP
jgi:hypothetical protein